MPIPTSHRTRGVRPPAATAASTRRSLSAGGTLPASPAPAALPVPASSSSPPTVPSHWALQSPRNFEKNDWDWAHNLFSGRAFPVLDSYYVCSKATVY